MFPRIIFTEAGKRMKNELQEQQKTELFQQSLKKKIPSNHAAKLNPENHLLNSATILMTNEDKFCSEIVESQKKITGLLKVKGKEEKLSYIKENLMPNLKNVYLPKFVEKKLQDSVDSITCNYAPSKNSGNSRINNADLFNESLKMVQTFESKLMKIYDKYQTFQLQEEKIKEELQDKLNKKYNSDKRRQFVDSKKMLKEFYCNHKEEINIMEKVSGENDRKKSRILKIHETKYQDFWKKISFPDKKERRVTIKTEFDYLDYKNVVNNRLAAKNNFLKKLSKSINYNIN